MLYNYPLKRCWFFFLISFLTYSQTNQPPVITANSRQAYCPQSQIRIAPNFTITDPDDTGIDALYIQISSGYVINEDRLELTGNHPNVSRRWSNVEGRLILASNSAIGAQLLYTDLQAAVRDIVFESNNPTISTEKFFSFTITDANFLPSNGHFYEYVPSVGIDWESARQAAEGRTYYGLQGYLATVTSQDEAQLVGSQVPGTGWIGGSDAAEEGVWRWVTGPETGQIFWNGGPNGSSPTFSFWNTGEPNNLANEDYAHVTGPKIGIPGSWNDIPLAGYLSGPFQPKGYVVEYGGMAGDPTINLSANTSIYIPVITSTTNAEVCFNGTTTLVATANEGDVFWYDRPNGGTLLFTGNTFITPVLTATTTYYVAPGPANCSSIVRTPVQAIISSNLPIANPVADLNICDDNADGNNANGISQSINLESQTAGIIGTQDPTQFTVTYHISRSDATAGSNALSSPFTNTTINSQTIYVRVTNNTTGCFTDSYSFNVHVRPLPIVAATVELKQCDDNNDGFSIFNLNEAAVNISANSANETFVFYPSVADAQAGTNAFTTTQSQAFTNRTVNTDVVGVRVISAFGCHSVGQVNLVVSPNSTIVTSSFPPVTYSTCDDFLDIDGNNNANNDDRDGIAGIPSRIFTDLERNLLSQFNTSVQSDLIVTFYRNLNDALSELYPIDISNYRNKPFNGISYANSQQIFVRVDNRVNNNCVGLAPLINFVVAPVPTAGTVRNLELCDNLDDGDNLNGIVQTFNLSSQTATILGTQNPANYQVTYHVSPGDAASGANAITNTTAYENRTSPNRQTIYVRVTNISNPTRCFTNHTSFDLIVHPLPVANPAGPVEVCDDDSDGSAQNGISQSIPIRARTEAAILGTQDPTQFSVSYHATRQNAINGVLPLNDVISNQALTNNIVYVRVFNSTTMCVNNISQFDVIVHPQPALPISITNYEDCDNNSNGTFRDGIISGIDLDTKIPEILPGVDASQFRVSFHETAQGAINNDTSIPNSRLYQNTTPYRQTIYVRVETIATGCVNNNRLRFDIVINNPPVFELTTPRILCLGETIRLEPINEGPDNYDYEWFLPNGTSQLGRTLDIRAGGTYRLVGRASNGNLGANGQPCSFEQTVQVNESIIATITENDVTIVDDSNNNSITINPANLGIGNYEYALRNDDTGTTTNFQDSPVFQNLSGGIYTILVRDKNGCGTAQLQVSVLEFPKFFTPNGDGTNDTWAIKGANSTFYPTSSIRIFNRYGKVVAEININTPGWDGTYNGKTLPSDDYWFSIELVHRNTSRSPIRRKGHFSLLRR